MATPAKETPWGLLSVDPDMAEMLHIVALCEAGLRLCKLPPNNDVTEVGMGQDLLWLLKRVRFTRNKGRKIAVIEPSGEGC
jgi:hypothetical protein